MIVFTDVLSTYATFSRVRDALSHTHLVSMLETQHHYHHDPLANVYCTLCCALCSGRRCALD